MTEAISFGQLKTILVETFRRLPDKRKGKNTQYAIGDAASAAFSVFFMQEPSFLAFQRHMQEQSGHNNAQSLFGVERIPSDPQIRDLLDPITSDKLAQPFWTTLSLLDHAGYLADYRYAGSLLLSFDGTGYFSSTEIHCPNCTHAVRGDTTYYSHSVMLPVLARPGKAEVLVLEPEFIIPQDGAEKQDCERNAAKRWVQRNAAHLSGQRVTVLTDDLHCNQPFCQLLLDHDLDFIMTCKPDSHPALYEEVTLLTKSGAVETVEDRVWTGKRHERRTYRFVEQVPLRGDDKALMVNWCEIRIVDDVTGKVLYHNAFATNRAVNMDTVRDTVVAGRCRWKVENEGNNVLKNQGYHFEHNYGHGVLNLSAVLLLLILLAFLCHTVLQLANDAYQKVRAALGPRKTFFDDIRALTRYLFFSNWEHLLDFMMVQLKLRPP